MADWVNVRVLLVEGRGEEFDPPPGRVFLVGPGHTFEDLAESIEASFGRWDQSHVREFELPNGRRVGPTDEDADPELIDEAEVEVLGAVRVGDRFTYVYDLGDSWLHRCEVTEADPDQLDWVLEDPPEEPAAVFGWGDLPDQYGRLAESDEDDDDDDDDEDFEDDEEPDDVDDA